MRGGDPQVEGDSLCPCFLWVLLGRRDGCLCLLWFVCLWLLVLKWGGSIGFEVGRNVFVVYGVLRSVGEVGIGGVGKGAGQWRGRSKISVHFEERVWCMGFLLIFT